MNENSASGAATFAQYWINVSDYASLTGDVEELRDLSSPECKGCLEYIELYEATYKAGGHFTGGRQSLSEVRVAPGDGTTRTVFASLDLAGGEYKEASDAEIRSVAAEKNNVVFTVSRARNGWTMRAFELEESNR